jgi:hypothetical protein
MLKRISNKSKQTKKKRGRCDRGQGSMRGTIHEMIDDKEEAATRIDDTMMKETGITASID